MTNKRDTAIANFLEDIKSSGITPPKEQEVASKPSALVERQKPALNYFVKKIPHTACLPWEFANRLDISTETCADLIDSINLVAQRIPAIVRPSKTNPDKYELICGARRLFACQTLDIDILVAIAELDDKEAALVMDLENREREDISAYERGRDYKRWIHEGIYKNAAEICQKTGIKKALLSQLMSIAELPEAVIRAFKHPSNLPFRWARELIKVYKTSPEHARKLTEIAYQLKDKELDVKEVFRQLRHLDQQKKVAPPVKKIIYDKDKKLIATIKKQNKKLTIHFNYQLSEEQENELENYLESLPR